MAGLTAGMWIAAGVLGWAGIAKVIRPQGTSTALYNAGLPSSRAAARSLGLVETAIAAVALATGGPVAAAALAAVYLALAVFSDRQRRRPAASCGCFGDADAPLTRTHVAINIAAALTAAGAAVAAAPGLVAATWSEPGVLLAAIVATASATCLVTQFLTTVPTLATRVAVSKGVRP